MDTENTATTEVMDTENTTTTEVTKSTKSIVPAKYGNKYRNGGADVLANFINAQCTGKDGFEYTAFFSLCRANSIDDAKVKLYEDAVSEKKHGAQGRARMTLRNILAGKARKEGKLLDLAGNEVSLDMPKVAVTGAAAAAQASSEAKVEEPGPGVVPDTSVEGESSKY